MSGKFNMPYKIFFGHQPALHHDPADGSLNTSQNKKHNHRKYHLTVEFSFDEKIKKPN